MGVHVLVAKPGRGHAPVLSKATKGHLAWTRKALEKDLLRALGPSRASNPTCPVCGEAIEGEAWERALLWASLNYGQRVADPPLYMC